MEKQELIEIGRRLRQRRQELGLTRDKMSELADNFVAVHVERYFFAADSSSNL